MYSTFSFYSQRSFLDKLSTHVSFIKSNGIEFCMALCKELSDDASEGITFKCVKDCYNMLDIVELEKSSNDDDPDDEENPFNPSGYEELAQALRSVIWSNVDMNHGKNNPLNSSATKLIVFFLFNQVSTNGKSQNGSAVDGENSSNEELDVESELENFEKLLSQMMQFRPATSNMSREDRLNCAQDFAEIFEKLILQDEDVSNLDND